jgi:hypothetical protein
MNAGLPGTGLGGLFYIASAVVMPLHRTLRGGGHAGRAWSRVAAQSGIALGILAALFATGWALGLLLMPGDAAVAAPSTLAGPGLGVVRWAAVLGTVGLLTLLLLGVEIAGVVLRRAGPRRRRPGARTRHARLAAVRRHRSTSDDERRRVA